MTKSGRLAEIKKTMLLLRHPAVSTRSIVTRPFRRRWLNRRDFSRRTLLGSDYISLEFPLSPYRGNRPEPRSSAQRGHSSVTIPATIERGALPRILMEWRVDFPGQRIVVAALLPARPLSTSLCAIRKTYRLPLPPPVSSSSSSSNNPMGVTRKRMEKLAIRE